MPNIVVRLIPDYGKPDAAWRIKQQMDYLLGAALKAGRKDDWREQWRQEAYKRSIGVEIGVTIW